MEQLGESSKPAKPQTNLLDLPPDVMLIIFIKLGVIDLLLNAQRVCSSWQAISKDPQLYRVLRIVKHYIPKASFELVEAVTIEAIKRSSGQLVEFSIEGFCTDQIMHALMHNSPMLKRFRLKEGLRMSDVFVGCPKNLDCATRVSDACLIQVFPNLPLLEEVEFLKCYSITGVMEVIASSCPNLKLLRFNPLYLSRQSFCDEEAFAVARDINPGLRRLDLSGTSITDTGLKALVERCTQLKYLRIWDCKNLNWDRYFRDESHIYGRIRRLSRLSVICP